MEIESINDNIDRFLLTSEDEGDELEDPENISYSYESEESSEDDGEVINDSNVKLWSSNIVKPIRCNFADDRSGLNVDLVKDCKNPGDYYNLFLDDDIIDFIVKETNRYGPTKNQNFTPTDASEIKTFFAIILQMGYVILPKLEDYWSKDISIGGHAICGGIMGKTRFISLMRSVHLTDNENSSGSKLYKVEQFLSLFVNKCQLLFRPGRDICMDESLIPFRGNLPFRQYMPNQRHNYGIKMFKLCSQHGYTFNMSIYAGKDDQARKGTVAEHVVMNLMNNLLDSGRILYTDNWYTSASLARKLLNRKTNLVGAVKDRIGLPKNVTSIKIKKGENVAEQSDDGILVMKWHDKRDVLMLSTLHDATIDENGKPEIILNYNKARKTIQLSDKMATHCPYARKNTKWYMRIFFHVISQIAVVNALNLYQLHNNSTMRITQFRREIVTSILKLKKPTTSRRKHILENMNGQVQFPSRRCKQCYQKLSNEFGSIVARKRSKQIKTRCSKCHNPFCLECFQKYHLKCY